jgi:hypothetical protein
MDLPVPLRKHFHEFLYEVQRLLHQIKAEDQQGVPTGLGVQRAGERIAGQVDVTLGKRVRFTMVLP